MWTESTAPLALGDLVEYLSNDVSVDAYDSFSGISGMETLNCVYAAPTTGGTVNIEYWPLYLLSR